MFNFIDNYRFIPVSVRIGRGPNALLCPGAYYAGMTALPLTHIWMYLMLIKISQCR
jgi:hypothetical protein